MTARENAQSCVLVRNWHTIVFQKPEKSATHASDSQPASYSSLSTTGSQLGTIKGFIRFGTREYVANDVQSRSATTLPLMAAFIQGLQVDWKKNPPEVSLPAIIPPLAMKSIICTKFLDLWYRCGQIIRNTKTLFIAGYSFGVADEHFNDLIRKGNQETRLIVVDPPIESVATRVCQTLNRPEGNLRNTRIVDRECKTGDRLTFVRVKAERIG